MSGALVDLYEAGFERRWLQAADQLAGRMVADFWDRQHGGFFYTSSAHQNLLVRTRPLYDGPVPSGNATAALVLLRLSKLLDHQEYFSKAEHLLASTAEGMRAQPGAHLSLLCAADFYLRPTREIVIAGRRHRDDTRRLLEVIHRRFIPNKILALPEPDGDSRLAEPDVPILAGKHMISGNAAVYVCENFTCRQPAIDTTPLEKILDEAIYLGQVLPTSSAANSKDK